MTCGQVGFQGDNPAGVLPYLIGPVGPSLEAGASHWAGEEEGPNVQVKAREVQTKRGTDSAAGALGSRHCHWSLEAGGEGQACWGAAEAGPATGRKAAEWKAPGVCCSGGGGGGTASLWVEGLLPIGGGGGGGLSSKARPGVGGRGGLLADEAEGL